MKIHMENNWSSKEASQENTLLNVATKLKQSNQLPVYLGKTPI